MKLAFIALIFSGFILGTLSVCPWEAPGLTKWSQWAGRPSSPNGNATIATNEKILLDVNAEFNSLQIEGQLIFLGTVGSLTLTANNIYVGPSSSATFVIGSKTCEYTNKATVILKGAPTPGQDGPFGTGTKTLSTIGGSIDIWGKTRTPTWTQLDGTATAGSTSIKLTTEVDWAVGEQIVIATTDYEDLENTIGASFCSSYCATPQNEVRVITARPDKKTVKFSQPLQFTHFGAFWKSPANTDSIDMRGEVGLLTRNIVIRGDDSSETTKWGGHMILNGAGQMRVSYAEFFFVGQAGEKGRYPFHLHRAGEQASSFAIGNSFHNSYQRAVTLHGTNKAQVALNVAFNVTGHIYFIEDGNEQGNVLEKNLGIFARMGSLLVSDAEPSIFWITNAANHFYDNVAVGGKFGYWYALPIHPLGFAVQPQDTRFLRFAPAGDFRGNKAHSCSDTGLFVDRGLEDNAGNAKELSSYNPVDSTRTFPLLKDPFNYLNGGDYVISQLGPRATATFADFTGYKMQTGFWFRGANMRGTGAKIADVMTGFSGPGSNNMVDNSIFVGETDNVGNLNAYDQKWWGDEAGRTRFLKYFLAAPIVGYRSYDAAGGDITMDNRFYSFKDFTFPNGEVRKAGSISGQGGPNVISPRNRYFRNTFFDVTRKFYLYDYTINNSLAIIPLGFSDTAMNGHVTVDADGSITGTCGASLLGFSPLLNQQLCNAASGNINSASTSNTVICGNNIIPHRHLSFFGGSQTTQTLSNTAQFTGALYRTNDAKTILIRPEQQSDLGNGQSTVLLLYNTNVVPNQEYFFGLVNNIPASTSNTAALYTNAPSAPYTLPSNLVVSLDSIMPGDFVRVALPMNVAPAAVTADYDNHPLTLVNSKTLLNRNTYFYDSAAKILWVELSNEEQFEWNFGVPVRIAESHVTITMGSCAGVLCTGMTAALPGAGPAPTTVNAGSLCQNGPVTGGQNVFTANGGSRFDVITAGVLNSNWQIAYLATGNAFSVDSTFATDNNLKAATGAMAEYGGVFFASKTGPLDPATFTHFEIGIRVAAGQVENSFGVFVSNGSVNSKNIQLDNPKYTAGPITDQGISRIVVPFSEMGIPAAPFKIAGLYIFNQQARPVNYVIDHVAFVSGTTAVKAISGWPVRPAVAALVGPGPSFGAPVVASNAGYQVASLLMIVSAVLALLM